MNDCRSFTLSAVFLHICGRIRVKFYLIANANLSPQPFIGEIVEQILKMLITWEPKHIKTVTCTLSLENYYFWPWNECSYVCVVSIGQISDLFLVLIYSLSSSLLTSHVYFFGIVNLVSMLSIGSPYLWPRMIA